MAALTDPELAKIRHKAAAAKGSGLDWTKEQINAASQTISAYLDDMLVTRPATSLTAAIDTATAPYQFSNGEKLWLFTFICSNKGA